MRGERFQWNRDANPCNPADMRHSRRLVPAAGGLASAILALSSVFAHALELPTDALSSCWFRINGPRNAATLGDWYTTATASSAARRHSFKISVPPGAALPVTVTVL